MPTPPPDHLYRANPSITKTFHFAHPFRKQGEKKGYVLISHPTGWGHSLQLPICHNWRTLPRSHRSILPRDRYSPCDAKRTWTLRIGIKRTRKDPVEVLRSFLPGSYSCPSFSLIQGASSAVPAVRDSCPFSLASFLSGWSFCLIQRCDFL